MDYPVAAELANISWWQQFEDPVLNELITIALNENKDLRIAAARVEEFAGSLQTTRSGFFPQVQYGGSASRDNPSLERTIPSLAQGGERPTSTFLTAFNVGWELDIWGRLQRANEAARADLLSAEEGRQAVILTIVSAVAVSYVELLSLDNQLNISRQTLATREKWLRMFEKKNTGGQVSNLELAQARSEYEQIASYIPTIERLVALRENSLSVLLGRNPGEIMRGKTLEMLNSPEVPQGLPSDLLIRRPDIKQREQDLIAANARIGVARTQYFPSISLTGLWGFASSSLSNLFVSSANLWQFGGDIVGPIFTGGRIEGEIIQAEAIQKQLLNVYLLTIQTAFREVEDALISIQKFRELQKIQVRHLSALKDYVNFARNRYDTGFSSYLEVMDAERDLYLAQIKYVQTEQDIFTAIVASYKAMGGGWVTEQDHQPDQPGKASLHDAGFDEECTIRLARRLAARFGQEIVIDPANPQAEELYSLKY